MKNLQPQSRFLTFAEAAREIGRTTGTIETYAAKGWFPVIRLTRNSYRIERADWEGFNSLMSYSDAGKEIGVTPDTIKVWADEKRFPIVRLSQRLHRIKRADWEAFLAKHRKKVQR